MRARSEHLKIENKFNQNKDSDKLNLEAKNEKNKDNSDDKNENY